MITKQQKFESPGTATKPEFYASIAQTIYNDGSKTSGIEKFFGSGPKAKFTFSIDKLNELTSYLKKPFGYELFGDLENANAHEDKVQKYNSSAKLRRFWGNFGTQEQHEIEDWAFNRCEELFQSAKGVSVKKKEAATELYTKEQKIRNAHELHNYWATLYPKRNDVYRHIRNTHIINPHLTIAEIEGFADAQLRSDISEVFHAFEQIVANIKNGSIDIDTFIAEDNGHLDGYYREIFFVLFPIKAKGPLQGHWARRSAIISELIQLLPFEKIKNKYSDIPEPVISLSPAGLNESSTRVDLIIDNFLRLRQKQIAVDSLLTELQKKELNLSISLVQQQVTTEQFAQIHEIIKYYASISTYYQHDRINLSYLCNKDPVKIKYWYNTHLKNLFQNESNPKWNELAQNILALNEVVSKINILNSSKIFDPAYPESEPFRTFSRKKLLTELKSLNDFLDYCSFDASGYYKMKDHINQIYNVLRQAEHLGIKSKDAYFLRKKLSSYLMMTGHSEDATKLRDYNFTLLPHVFKKDAEKELAECKEEEALYYHNATGWKNFNKDQIDFCINTWGPNSVQSFKALTCKACMFLKFGLFEQAEEVIGECDKIKQHADFDINELPMRLYHIDLQYGKIYYYKAKRYEKTDITQVKSNLEIAIGHFNKALNNYTLADTKHIYIYYVHYYLYSCYKLLNDKKVRQIHFDKFYSFFQNHPLQRMCQVDVDELRETIKRGF